MLDRLRYLLSSPLAQPERLGVIRRFLPWSLAAAISVLVWLAFCDDRQYRSVAIFGHLGFQLAFLSVVPAASALCFLAERSRGSLESLLLTPEDRLRLVVSRLWRVVRPWMGAMLLLLPVYVTLSVPLVESHDGWADPHAYLIAPQPVVYSTKKGWLRPRDASGMDLEPMALFGAKAHVVHPFAIVHDLLLLLYVAAFGLAVGIRFHGTWQALTLSYLFGPVLLGTVYRADLWLFFHRIRDSWGSLTPYAVWLNVISGLELLALVILPVLAIRGAARCLDKAADRAPA